MVTENESRIGWQQRDVRKQKVVMEKEKKRKRSEMMMMMTHGKGKERKDWGEATRPLASFHLVIANPNFPSLGTGWESSTGDSSSLIPGQRQAVGWPRLPAVGRSQRPAPKFVTGRSLRFAAPHGEPRCFQRQCRDSCSVRKSGSAVCRCAIQADSRRGKTGKFSPCRPFRCLSESPGDNRCQTCSDAASCRDTSCARSPCQCVCRGLHTL
eukprot:12140_3